MAETINEFIQPPILKYIRQIGQQSAFLYITSNQRQHSCLEKVRALMNWLDHHGIVYYTEHESTTQFQSITDIISHIMSNEEKKNACYQDIPLTNGDHKNLIFNDSISYTNFFLFCGMQENGSSMKKKSVIKFFLKIIKPS